MDRQMTVTAVTTWEGTPAAIETLVAGSRAAAPIHESLGAKNPRLMRAASGTGSDGSLAYYSIEFDSIEAYGAFFDKVLTSDWYAQTIEVVSKAYPDLKNGGTVVYYDAISD